MKVCVRRVGAIGFFYWHDFECETRDEWFEKFSSEWELFCFELE